MLERREYMKVSAGDLIIKKDIEKIIESLGGISFREKTVLITGGAGFLGSWMCDILMEQGARVICLDNLSSGRKDNIYHLLEKEGFEFIEHDITEQIKLNNKIDLVLHMASRASPLAFKDSALEILKANTLGTMNALELVREHKARFLFTSTSEAYGNPSSCQVPTPESYNGNVNPVGPRGCYDESKRCGEAFVVAYRKQYEMDTRIARIFNTYGPRMRGDGNYGRAVSIFLKQALNGEPITVFGDGKQTRSFCYVTDQIEGLLRLCSVPGVKESVINIGNEEEVSITALANTIKKQTDSSSEIKSGLPLPEDDPRRRCPDITRAKNILGWQPKTALKEGLNKTIEWLRKQN